MSGSSDETLEIRSTNKNHGGLLMPFNNTSKIYLQEMK